MRRQPNRIVLLSAGTALGALLLSACGGSSHTSSNAAASASASPSAAGGAASTTAGAKVTSGTATLKLNSATHSMFSAAHVTVSPIGAAKTSANGSTYTFPATGGTITSTGSGLPKGTVDLNGGLAFTIFGQKLSITHLVADLSGAKTTTNVQAGASNSSGGAAASTGTSTSTNAPVITGTVHGQQIVLFGLSSANVTPTKSSGTITVNNVPVTLGGPFLAQLGVKNAPSTSIGTLQLSLQTSSS